MTSERPRFPVGLTLAAAIVFAICCGLGVWQLQRAAWKAHELARINAMKGGPPQPIGPLLARNGLDASFARVQVDCGLGSHADGYGMTTDNGEWIARPHAICRLPAGGPYVGIKVDRGYLTNSRGATAAPTLVLPPPVHVVGVLYRTIFDCPPPPAACSTRGLAPYTLVAERETPAPPGVMPAPYPDAAGNLEYVGSYAPTWFGLAGVLGCFYAAMLWRRYHPKR